MEELVGKDGGVFRIIARGDCTSRRSVQLNRDLFPKGVDFIQSQKSTAIQFLDAAAGMSATRDDLQSICDTATMTGALPDFYLGQADRSILSVQDADLIMIDSYADMNFELWENIESGWKIWIHPKFLINPEKFYADFRKLGRRTFEQSVREITALVTLLRAKNPDAPVLFLNQQVDYYPKMAMRMEYYQLGDRLVKEVPNSYFGGVVEKDALKLADIGSCGPGLTLHFQAETYRGMWQSALENGLRTALATRHTAKKAEQAAPIPSQLTGEPDFSKLIARDNRAGDVFPIEAIDFQLHSSGCNEKCPARERLVRSFENYVRIHGSDNPLRWTPAVIDLRAIDDYAQWEHAVKKAYDRVRMKRKSIKAGYVFKQFHPKLFSVDIHQINQSTTVRSGGEIRGSLVKTIEELGGYPVKYINPVVPTCSRHWQMSFGVFQEEPGYRQGEVTVDQRLLGYISVNRNGDICNYSQIIGHQDFLNEGVMYHCHFNIVEWLAGADNRFTAGAKFLMYGGIGNGGAGLWQWKRTSGFTPMHLYERQSGTLS